LITAAAARKHRHQFLFLARRHAGSPAGLRETISAQPPQRHRRRIFAWFFIVCHADRMTRTAICLKAENMSRFRLPLFQISAFPLITPPLPLEKIPIYPHRLDAARVIRLGAVIKKEPGQPNSQTL